MGPPACKPTSVVAPSPARLGVFSFPPAQVCKAARRGATCFGPRRKRRRRQAGNCGRLPLPERATGWAGLGFLLSCAAGRPAGGEGMRLLGRIEAASLSLFLQTCPVAPQQQPPPPSREWQRRRHLIGLRRACVQPFPGRSCFGGAHPGDVARQDWPSRLPGGRSARLPRPGGSPAHDVTTD